MLCFCGLSVYPLVGARTVRIDGPTSGRASERRHQARMRCFFFAAVFLTCNVDIRWCMGKLCRTKNYALLEVPGNEIRAEPRNKARDSQLKRYVGRIIASSLDTVARKKGAASGRRIIRLRKFRDLYIQDRKWLIPLGVVR